jgi:hypothetical protein
MKVLDWMGRDIIVPCDSTKVWERVAQETGGRDLDEFSFDAWKRTINLRIDDKVFNVDISDLITGKMEVVSPGYKGEVNNEGLES